MYKNELFILMYCVPMIPTGELFQFFHFLWFTMLLQKNCEKNIFHVELEREFSILCFTILVVATARRPAPAGCGRLRLNLREACGYLPGSHAALHLHHIPHRGAHHQPCSGSLSSQNCGCRQDRPPKGSGGGGAFMAWATLGLPSGGVAN